MSAIYIYRLRKIAFPSKQGLINEHSTKLRSRDSRKAIC